MALESQPRDAMVREYWPRYRRFALALTIGMQILLAITIGLSLLFSGVDLATPQFWIVMLAVIFASTGINIILVHQVLRPLKDLTSALTHASGEPTDIIPPNPNARHYERDGFKPLLQYIYEHSETNTAQDAKTQAATSQLERAFNQTSAGIVIMNAEGEITFANAHAPIMTDSEGRRRLKLLFEDDDSFQTWRESCNNSSVHAEKVWLRIPDAIVGDEDRRIFDISATYEKGSGSDIVLVMFDRSSLYQPEDDALDFIAFAAHELRGPITVIRGYLDVLDTEIGETLDAEQRELITRLTVSANRLTSYISNILNASKYDRRHLRFRLAEESLSSIYETVNDDLQLRAQAQNRLLSVTIPPDLPTIAADRSSLSEVISNLVDNAIKYSNEGGSVAVSATAEGDFVRVNVVDTGIGMPSNVVSNLFHKFYRSHRSRETVAGTGIGLYISKAIVESHGGRIGVKSQEGVGSLFYFTIPTYASVKEKLLASGSTNEGIISEGKGWIKNHSSYNS